MGEPAGVLLRVADLAAERAFYDDLLGGAPGIELEAAPGAPPRPAAAPGLYHAALLLPDRRSLGRVLTRLVAAGYPLQGGGDHAVSEAVYLADPEGNGVELYADRPRSVWRWQAGQVEMTTLPLDWRGLLELGRESGPAPLPAETRLGHIHLQVSDLEASVAFYARALGLELMARFGGQAAFLATGGYHHHLGLNTWASRGAPPAPEESLGLAEVRFSGAPALVDPDGIRLAPE